MKKTTIMFALLIVALTTQIASAQTDKDKNKELLIKITKFLEEKPFDEKAKQYRETGFAFVAQTEDVSVMLCGDLTKEVTKKKNKYGGELLIQYSLGMAAFKLNTPEKKDDENAAQLAGIESMLKAYEAMLTAKSDAKFAGMDDLVIKRKNGGLKLLIEAANCAKKGK